MRKFIITNPMRFKGEAELTYNGDGKLIVIDVSNTSMCEATIMAFKKAVATNVNELPKSFTSDTTIVEGNFDVSFDMFWKAYPLKRNRYKCEKLFNGLSVTERVKAYYSLDGYTKYLNKNKSWLTPMIGDRYLRDREYETEYAKL